MLFFITATRKWIVLVFSTDACEKLLEADGLKKAIKLLKQSTNKPHLLINLISLCTSVCQNGNFYRFISMMTLFIFSFMVFLVTVTPPCLLLQILCHHFFWTIVTIWQSITVKSFFSENCKTMLQENIMNEIESMANGPNEMIQRRCVPLLNLLKK